MFSSAPLGFPMALTSQICRSMEYLNKVELVGVIGSARTIPVGTQFCYRFSVATDYSYRDTDGTPVIETTWHSCTAFLKDEEPELKKGARVRLEGRLRNIRFTDTDGNERTVSDIIVNTVKVI